MLNSFNRIEFHWMYISYLYIFVKSPQEPPEIILTIGDKQLDYVVGKNQWNDEKYGREDTFKKILKNYPASELSYIEIGTTATWGQNECEYAFIIRTD